MSRLTASFQNSPPVSQLVDRSATASPSSRNANLEKLRRFSLFAGVGQQQMEQLVAKAHYRDFTANEMVVDSGDVSNEVFFILEGAVRVVARTVFGYEAILNEMGPGEFFGEVAAIDGSHRSANVTALQRTRLCIVPAASFVELTLSSRDVGLSLLRMLCARLRTKDERLIEFSVLSVRQRLISELLRLSRDRGGVQRVLSPPPPHHILAAWISTRRESVTRELNDMARTGLIKIDRQSIVLLSPEKLRAEVEARTGSKLRPDGLEPAD